MYAAIDEKVIKGAKLGMSKESNPAGISDERLAKITEDACGMLREYRSQMGLDLGTQLKGLSARGRERTWLWRRQHWRSEWQGDFFHRRSTPGGVFFDSWWSFGIANRIAGYLASKLADDLLGSDPFFAAMPENIDDPDTAQLAKEVERKVQKELTVSNFAEVCQQAIRDAMVEGERCVMLNWVKDTTSYPGPATVLVGKDKKPVKTPNGDYVYQYDDVLDVLVDPHGNFVKSLQAAIKDGSVTMGKDADGNDVPQIPSTLTLEHRLKKEPAFQMPADPDWQFFDDLEITIIHKNGLVADVILPEDFIFDIFQARLELCPLLARSIDMSLKELIATYPGSNYEARLKLSETGAMSHAGQPIWEKGEQQRYTTENPLMNIHECYYRVRVDPESKVESWLYLIIDVVNQIPLFCEYLGKMRMKKPPFFLVRGFESVTARAYGMGVFEKMEDKSLAIDTFFNRLCLKSSKSASVTWFHPDAFTETKSGGKLVIGGKQLYRMQRQTDVEYGVNNPPVGRVNLNEVDEFSRDVMKDMVGEAQLEFGVTAGADVDASHQNTPSTATEIKNVERTGNTVQKATESLKVQDLTPGVEMAVDMILENMDPEEAKWTPNEDKLATLNREEIRALPRDVRILLTKTDAPDGIEVAEAALSTMEKWVANPPQIQKQVRPLYLKIMKDYKVPDADEMLHDPTPEELQAASTAQANAAKLNDQFRFNSADLGPLTPFERAQVLSKFGVQASPDADVLKMQQEQAQQEAMKKSLGPAQAAQAGHAIPPNQGGPQLPSEPPVQNPAGTPPAAPGAASALPSEAPLNAT